MTRIKRTLTVAAAALSSALVLSACGSNSSPLEEEGADTDNSQASEEAIVIGSQDYYSNEIIAEAYAQALENAGYEVDRQFRIGQREAYLPEIEAGDIDLFPEYSGPVLQYWEPDTEARLPDDVYAELEEAAPDGPTSLNNHRQRTKTPMWLPRSSPMSGTWKPSKTSIKSQTR